MNLTNDVKNNIFIALGSNNCGSIYNSNVSGKLSKNKNWQKLLPQNNQKSSEIFNVQLDIQSWHFNEIYRTDNWNNETFFCHFRFSLIVFNFLKSTIKAGLFQGG